MSNLKPTPETDAVWNDKNQNILEHAKKMELERNLARATCEELVTDSDAVTLAQTVVKLERERDEARALLTQCSAEKELNAMQALAYKADADSMRKAIKEAQLNYPCNICEHPDFVQKLYRFNNNYGASVVQWINSNDYVKNLYELAVVSFNGPLVSHYSINYHTPITNDVFHSLTAEEVENTLNQIKSLP